MAPDVSLPLGRSWDRDLSEKREVASPCRWTFLLRRKRRQAPVNGASIDCHFADAFVILMESSTWAAPAVACGFTGFVGFLAGKHVARFLLQWGSTSLFLRLPGGLMFRSVLVGTAVASLLGLALVDAQVSQRDYAEPGGLTASGPSAETQPSVLAFDTNDATAEASAPEPAPQEPAYWAENRPPAGTPRSLPKRLFPADNWWNLKVVDAPLDPKSAGFIESIKLGGNPTLRYDWGNNYGLPFVTVSGNYPKVRFQSCSYWGETDQIAYPIPIPALTEPGWTEDLTGTIDNPVSTGDRHLIIVDVDNQFLYEIYQPYRNATGSPKTMPNGTVLQPGNFYCASAAMWDIKTNNTRPDGWTSSDAAGLQVLPGLVQYDEVVGPDPITHAHRITLNWSSSQAPKYVWPATHFAGSYSATNPPLGTRLRLKASKDLSFAGPHARKVLQAMKDYGVIFADNGGHGMVTGTNDPRWGNYDSPIRTEFTVAFSQVNLSDFEVVELGWRPSAGPTTPTIRWPTPDPIVQGKPLGPDELSAEADVQGTFMYDPPAGSVLSPGVHTLTVTFIPVDSAATAADATTVEGEEPSVVHGPMESPLIARETSTEAVASVSLVVLAQPRTTPAIDWASPAPIMQGTALSAAQLSARSPVPGTFVYAPAAGTGPRHRHTHAVRGIHARRHHALQQRDCVHGPDRQLSALPVDGDPPDRGHRQRRRDQLRHGRNGVSGDDEREHVARAAGIFGSRVRLLGLDRRLRRDEPQLCSRPERPAVLRCDVHGQSSDAHQPQSSRSAAGRWRSSAWRALLAGGRAPFRRRGEGGRHQLRHQGQLVRRHHARPDDHRHTGHGRPGIHLSRVDRELLGHQLELRPGARRPAIVRSGLHSGWKHGD